MPRPALTAHEVRDFRARLTAAATQLFAAHGPRGVTLRAVAAAMGVSPMTPYRYVAGADELLALVRTEAFRRFADDQEQAARTRGRPLARLAALGRAYVRFALADPDAYRIMFELAQPAGAPEPLRREAARAFAPLSAAAAAAVAAGELRGDPLTYAHLLWATTHGLVTLHLAGKLGMGRDLEALVSQVVPAARGGPVRAVAPAREAGASRAARPSRAAAVLAPQTRARPAAKAAPRSNARHAAEATPRARAHAAAKATPRPLARAPADATARQRGPRARPAPRSRARPTPPTPRPRPRGHQPGPGGRS